MNSFLKKFMSAKNIQVQTILTWYDYAGEQINKHLKLDPTPNHFLKRVYYLRVLYSFGMIFFLNECIILHLQQVFVKLTVTSSFSYLNSYFLVISWSEFIVAFMNQSQQKDVKDDKSENWYFFIVTDNLLLGMGLTVALVSKFSTIILGYKVKNIVRNFSCYWGVLAK